MITIATIVGARPQFIKAAAISRAIAMHNKFKTNGLPPINEIIFHTGQHYDYELSAVFFKELGLPDRHGNGKIRRFFDEDKSRFGARLR